MSESESKPATAWIHRPAHLFVPEAMYMVTAGTYQHIHLFAGEERLALLQNILFQAAEKYCWQLQAWAILENHYHFIAQAPEDPKTLKFMTQRIHSESARKINQMDQASGRQVWFEYWDNCITFEKSYYARLNYVRQNPRKHGVVAVAENYPFCSASWFLAKADPQFYKKVTSFRFDKLKIPDDF